MLTFFFFKQKTAYEMRISDWSSDVCSSDLSDRADKTTARPGIIEGKPSAQALAVEVAQAEAHQQQHAEIRHHARDDQHTQAQETLEHLPFAPGRHEMHHPQQHR